MEGSICSNERGKYMTEEQSIKQRINAFVNAQMGENDVMNISEFEVKNDDDLTLIFMIFIFSQDNEVVYTIDLKDFKRRCKNHEKIEIRFFSEKRGKECCVKTTDFKLIKKREGLIA